MTFELTTDIEDMLTNTSQASTLISLNKKKRLSREKSVQESTSQKQEESRSEHDETAAIL